MSTAINLIEELAKLTDTPGNGVTRKSYSTEDRKAREIIREKLKHINLDVWTDWIGNLNATLPGKKNNLPPIYVGSHIDSVKNAGKYDGIVGVAAALEVIEKFQKNNCIGNRPIRFIAFAEEEGSNFSVPLLGSKALVGILGQKEIEKIYDQNGNSAWKIITEFLKNEKDYKPKKEKISEKSTMIELHVEQSGELEINKKNIGIVEEIGTNCAIFVTLKGMASHSGTTPMENRKDALAAAAEIITLCEKLSKKGDKKTTLYTVGKIECQPNIFNSIPEKVTISIDFRSKNAQKRKEKLQELYRNIEKISKKRNIKYEVNKKDIQAVKTNKNIQKIIKNIVENKKIPHQMIASMAMHDASAFATIMPTAMIFIPSKNGISHNKLEYTKKNDIKMGINVLYETIKKINQ